MSVIEKAGTVAGTGSIDLLDERLGGKALFCSDERFASMHNLVKHREPTFSPETFDDQGQVYSGWESGRNYKRKDSHEFDWCVLQLGATGRIDLVDIDTSFFRGNFPSFAELEGCCYPNGAPSSDQSTWAWTGLLGRSALKGHSHNFFSVKDNSAWTHLRIKSFPDGGIARLRAYGSVVNDPQKLAAAGEVELSSVLLGGQGVSASDMFYSPVSNMLYPGRAYNMGQGWETARKRGAGHNWAIIKLGVPGSIQSVEIDTNHFKNNAPESFSLEGVLSLNRPVDLLTADALNWSTVIERTSLEPHHQNRFSVGKSGAASQFSHVRLNIYPDGGVSRLRINGRAQQP
jgi:allantoicase